MISGSNLSGATVSFGGVGAATSQTTATSIIAKVPPGAKSGDIIVTNNGKTATKAGFVVLQKKPVVAKPATPQTKPHAGIPK